MIAGKARERSNKNICDRGTPVYTKRGANICNPESQERPSLSPKPGQAPVGDGGSNLASNIGLHILILPPYAIMPKLSHILKRGKQRIRSPQGKKTKRLSTVGLSRSIHSETPPETCGQSRASTNTNEQPPPSTCAMFVSVKYDPRHSAAATNNAQTG